MSKARALLAAVAVALATQGPAPALPPSPVSIGTRPCTPVGPLDVVRPPGCQRTTYVYGPLHITPGDNLILFGPVTVERPRAKGYVVRFRPDLIRVNGSVPPIDEVHLHHSVWISTRFGHPMFASGEEKTIFSIPNGYGIPFDPLGELWLLNYMVHNLLATPDNVFITYEVDFIPQKSAGSIKPVEPFWLDVAGYNGANPIYNTQRGFGAVPGECSFPREKCAAFDPYGKTNIAGQGIAGNGVGFSASPPAGTIVWMVGHVHPGGLRTDVEVQRPGVGTTRVFTSDAVYWDPNGPVSWDMAMETTRPDYRLRISPGDRLVLNSVYETSRASWFEGMGIVVLFIARDDSSGPDPFVTAVDPDNAAITHGHLPEAGRHGGPDQPVTAPPSRVAWSDVGIVGFSYLPGGETLGIPTVKRGQPIRFYNFDAAAQIFHTITSCAWPCNGPTGISYPLANGPIDFDSLELGYGVPGLTAAANRGDFTIDTTPFPPGEYSYFCRIHPSMRGAFAVE